MIRPSSVIHGRDPAVLQALLDFYVGPGKKILDVTANRRRMWRGVAGDYAPNFMDIDPKVGPDIVGDFRAIPVPDASLDVLVFDPPHLPAAAGSKASLRQMREDYGLSDAPKADNVAAYFAPLLTEAARVLRLDGLILAKIKDYTHNHAYQWMLVEWINAVRSTPGLTPCDLVIKVDPCGGNLKSGRWEKAHHVRNSHCYWSVVRKGRCEPRRTA